MFFESLPAIDLDSLLRAQLNSLIDRSFDTFDYRASFPLVFGSQPSVVFNMLLEEGSPLAALAVFSLALSYSGPSKRTGNDFPRMFYFACLGSVCVEAKRRGEGLAAQLIERTAQRLRDQGYAAVGLFALDGRLYEKLGFRFAKPDTLGPLNDPLFCASQSSLGSAPNLAWTYAPVQSLAPQERRELWSLACQPTEEGPFRVNVGFGCFDAVLTQTPMDILVARRHASEKEILSALFFEKGSDFSNTWHGLIARTDATQAELGQMLCEARRLQPGSQAHFCGNPSSQLAAAIDSLKLKKNPTFMIRNLMDSKTHCDPPPPWERLFLPSLLSI
jgi:GNAT superfamily N-acetyltransferase